MLMRSAPATLDFLDRARVKGHENEKWSEQDAVRNLVYADDWDRADRVIAERQVMMIPQRAVNAFPSEIPCVQKEPNGFWRRGDLLIHFAGAWAHVKEEDPTGFLMKKYGAMEVE